ncbi:MAG: winged helix-turn-helix transcriptional regulator [Alphaproteobacteria bacterium]
MPRSTQSAQEKACSVARSLAIVGDPWSYLVLREVFFHLRRFDEIQDSLGVARNILATRLRHLVKSGVLERKRYRTHPPRNEYRLTEMGLALYPALLTMIAWGDKWLAGKAGPPLLLTHKTCGKHFHAEIRCSACDEKIYARDVLYRPGPGAGFARLARGQRRRAVNPDAYERGRHCSVARTLKVMGDPWAFLVLREAFFGVHRFDDMQANLRIARNILTDRLERLVAGGVLRRQRYQRRPDRYEYRFTDKGLELYDVVLALMQWGDAWLDGGKGPPLRLFHESCGQVFTPSVACSACRASLAARAVRYAPGPGAKTAEAK